MINSSKELDNNPQAMVMVEVITIQPNPVTDEVREVQVEAIKTNVSPKSYIVDNIRCYS